MAANETTLPGFIGIMVSIIVGIFFSSWVLMLIWNWSLYEIGFPLIPNINIAVLILLMVSLLTGSLPERKKETESEEIEKILVSGILYPLIALIICFVVHTMA